MIKEVAIGILKNRSIWFWSVLFVLVWAVIGSFIASKGVAVGSEKYYVSAWYSIEAVISAGASGTSIAYITFFSSSSLAYLFRFSRLKPVHYELIFLVGYLITSITTLTTVTAANIFLFSLRFGRIILPEPYIIPVIIITGAFMYVFSVMVALMVNNHFSLKNASFTSFVPLFLAFISAYLPLYVNISRWIAVAYPFLGIEYLLSYAFTGTVNLSLATPSSSAISPAAIYASVIGWTAILFITDVILLRRIKPRSAEEMRQL
ncbi:hypothetical protein [Thermoplasma sp.]|uniref:hypothetical protein n=1 Tax=Thermoplasma sp. TaxID=1973142 RepID=UPI002636B52C|nr:hypothetical protein [Thermoplasma sp.]